MEGSEVGGYARVGKVSAASFSGRWFRLLVLVVELKAGGGCVGSKYLSGEAHSTVHRFMGYLGYLNCPPRIRYSEPLLPSGARLAPEAEASAVPAQLLGRRRVRSCCL